MLAVEPFCRLCVAAGRITRDNRATVLDHIVPLSEGGGNDDANLQPLCADCHDLKTAKEAARARGAAEPTSITRKPMIGADGWPK